MMTDPSRNDDYELRAALILSLTAIVLSAVSIAIAVTS